MKRFGKNLGSSLTLILLLFSSGFLHLCAHMTNDSCTISTVTVGSECRISHSDAQPGMETGDDCPFCAGLFSHLWLTPPTEFHVSLEPLREITPTIAAMPLRLPGCAYARAPPHH